MQCKKFFIPSLFYITFVVVVVVLLLASQYESCENLYWNLETHLREWKVQSFAYSVRFQFVFVQVFGEVLKVCTPEFLSKQQYFWKQ